MTVLRRSDLLRPRLVAGTLRMRLTVAVARRTGRMVSVQLHPDLPRLLVPADDWVGHFLREEAFEAQERDFVERALAPGDAVVDVGAHMGVYTLLAGHLVGEAGSVVALEPNPESFAVLEQNVIRHRLGNRVRVRHAAASDRDGSAELHMPPHHQAAWSALAEPSVGTARTVRVETVTLDSLLGDQRPFLVKIDVEGWERHVVAGAQRLLAAADGPHLLVEFSDVSAESADTTTSALADDLSRFGYEVFRYDPDRVALDPVGSYLRGNLVASKRIDELRSRLSH
jgi:FkbM family methyltransferase